MADKVTMREFSERLGAYASAGAARKAVGRFSGWSDEEKARAHRMIGATFGEEVRKKSSEPPKRRGRPPKSAQTPAAPKRRGRPPKKVAAPAAPKKRGRPPKKATAPASTGAPKRRGRPPKSAAASAPAAARVDYVRVEPGIPMLDPSTSARFMAERSIQTLSVAIANAEALHRIQPTLCLDASVKKMAELHNDALDLFAKSIKPSMEVREEKIAIAAPPPPVVSAPAAPRRGRPPKKKIDVIATAPGGNGQSAIDVSAHVAAPLFSKPVGGTTSV